MADLIIGLGALALGILLIVAGIRGMKNNNPVKVKTKNTYWAECEGCGATFRKFTMAAEKAKHCPSCGREIEWKEKD